MCTWGAMQRNGLKRLRHHLTSAMPGCSGSSSSTHSPPDKCAYSRQLSTQCPPDVVFQEMGRAVSVGKTALPVATAAALLNLLGLHSCYSRSGLLLGKAPQSSGQNAQQHNVQTRDAPRLAPFTWHFQEARPRWSSLFLQKGLPVQMQRRTAKTQSRVLVSG